MKYIDYCILFEKQQRFANRLLNILKGKNWGSFFDELYHYDRFAYKKRMEKTNQKKINIRSNKFLYPDFKWRKNIRKNYKHQ